jgi:hypothetical protein
MPTDAIGIYKSAMLPCFLQASLRKFKKHLDALGNTILTNHGDRKRSIGECEAFRRWTFEYPPELSEAYFALFRGPSAEALPAFSATGSAMPK